MESINRIETTRGGKKFSCKTNQNGDLPVLIYNLNGLGGNVDEGPDSWTSSVIDAYPESAINTLPIKNLSFDSPVSMRY